MKYCENCGKKLSDSASFCSACGEKTTTEQVMKDEKSIGEDNIIFQASDDESVVSEKNSQKKRLLIISGIAVVVIVLALVVIFKVIPSLKGTEEPEVVEAVGEDESVEAELSVDLNDLKTTLPWEDSSQKVEEFKQKSLTDYPEKKIADMFQNGETVKEWKYATHESNVYFLCNYVLQNNQAYSVIYVQNVDNSINIAELYVDDEKQASDVIVAYCDMMFVPAPVYIISDSDTRYLTEAEIEALDPALLRLARNEIFARHGRIFQDQELADYFNSQSWYEGTAADVSLSDVETANVDLIHRIETGADDFNYRRVDQRTYYTSIGSMHLFNTPIVHFYMDYLEDTVFANIYYFDENNSPIASDCPVYIEGADTVAVYDAVGGNLIARFSWESEELISGEIHYWMNSYDVDTNYFVPVGKGFGTFLS